LVYDISNYDSFLALSTFLHDARALASPKLTVVLAGNKSDVAPDYTGSAPDADLLCGTSVPESLAGSVRSTTSSSILRAYRSTMASMTVAQEGREVFGNEAATWAQQQGVSVATEVSALTGDSVEEAFTRLARIILTRIELGEVDPSDPTSGIQYGDSWAAGTMRSVETSKLRDWEEVFRIDKGKKRRCC
jgi:GTPase SAR1 family protein